MSSVMLTTDGCKIYAVPDKEDVKKPIFVLVFLQLEFLRGRELCFYRARQADDGW